MNSTMTNSWFVEIFKREIVTGSGRRVQRNAEASD